MLNMYRFVIKLFFGLLLHFSTFESIFSAGNVIRTRNGLIEGVQKVARNQTKFIAYYGIPYAKAPVGKLRFEPPVQADPWKGVFNATQESLLCPQIPEKTDYYAGQEDCLIVNVYTPKKARPGSNIPVLFYIFGGEFKYGSASKEGPEFIMSREIILIVASYRLGVLGFLSTGDAVIPGNMALKDQTLALKWTKENIYDFGGDPRRITIYGHSSGAMCVHMHTFSPLSKDYFDQVIMQSGFMTSPQSFWKGDTARCVAHRFAEEVNCTTATSKSLKACLQEKDAQELVTAAEKLFIWNESHMPAVFKPVIEEKYVDNAFLTEIPIIAPYASHTKPWLLGMTSGEEAHTIRDWVLNKEYVFDFDYYKLWFAVISSLKWTSKPNDLNFIIQLSKTWFFRNETISKSTAKNLMKLLNGIMFGYGLLEAVEKNDAIKYLYLYDYRNVGGLKTDAPFFGVGHSSEVALIFNRTNGEGIAAEDYEFGDEMITRLINFVYSGNPNQPFPINTSVFGSWMPASKSRMEFLRLTKNGSMEQNYFLENFDFWTKIPIFSNYF